MASGMVRCKFRIRVVGYNWAVFTTEYRDRYWYCAGGQMAEDLDSLKIKLRRTYGKNQ